MTYDLNPRELTWADVDPRQHSFDSASALEVVSALDPARRVPVRPAGSAAVHDWVHDEGRPWADAMTRALVERYGRWVLGWSWGHDESDFGGGPVGGWCCAYDSITTPGETLTRVANALCEWRGWLEDLAGRFDRYPLPAQDRRHVWERAAAHLVTHVVDRTGAGDAWYEHCAQVLTWYLTRWGEAPQSAQAHVAEAIGGRFGSWIAPEDTVVSDVAGRLAASLERGDYA